MALELVVSLLLAAVDAGVALPTVNDDFSGRAPDLGALEVGRPAPHYGPRWLKRQRSRPQQAAGRRFSWWQVRQV